MFVETGPHEHAVRQTFLLYADEPGGNRIEPCNAGARLILAPGRQPTTWSEAERAGDGRGAEDHRVLPRPRHPTGRARPGQP